MKKLVVILALQSLAPAATDIREAQLEQLKRAFPTHVAGEVTERSDPAVIQCFTKYRRRVVGLKMDGLATALQRIKDDAAWELREIETRLHHWRSWPKSSSRHAEQQNGNWIRQKLIPYLNRLQQFQRGR